VKNPQKKGTCAIHYHDIGDYLSREEKLSRLAEFGRIAHVPWERITPNAHHDWINVRSEDFGSLVPLNDAPNAIFSMRSNGVQTNRDVWVYNFSKAALEDNIRRMIDFFNDQVETFGKICQTEGANAEKKAQELIDTDPKKIKWTRGLIGHLSQGKNGKLQPEDIGLSLYRPFCKSWIYYNRQFNEYFKEKLFPSAHHENLAIAVTGTGSSKDFSCLMVNTLPDLEVISKGQCFPLYYYEKAQSAKIPGLTLSDFSEEKYVRKEAITDMARADFREHYRDDTISKEDIFYYIYGVLHSPEYRERFASDLKKMLPRIPFVSDFWGFSKAGRELAHWHLNYETVDPWPLEEKKDNSVLSRMTPKEFFRIEEMKFGKNGKEKDKTTIVYNSRVTLFGIPLEAYEYVVNGKPALEWVMERYAVKIDKDSGIKNDPNLWSEDPRYILDLVKRIVRVSFETVRIVNGLPALTEQENKSVYTPSFFGGESVAAEDPEEVMLLSEEGTVMKMIEEPVNVFGPKYGLVIRRVDCRDPNSMAIVSHYFEVVTAFSAARKNGTFKTLEAAKEFLSRNNLRQENNTNNINEMDPNHER
jgi:predicted helicase